MSGGGRCGAEGPCCLSTGVGRGLGRGRERKLKGVGCTCDCSALSSSLLGPESGLGLLTTRIRGRVLRGCFVALDLVSSDMVIEMETDKTERRDATGEQVVYRERGRALTKTSRRQLGAGTRVCGGGGEDQDATASSS